MRDCSGCHRNRTLTVATLAVLAAWTLPRPAGAEPGKAADAPGKEKAAPAATAKAGPKETKDEVSAEKEARREKVAAIKEEGKERIAAAKEALREKVAAAKAEASGDKPAATPGIPAGPERAERARERRRGEMARFRARIKRASEIPTPIREALRMHARRSARLAYIRGLAEAASDKKSIAQCDKLMALEDERHGKRMDRLWSKHGPAGAAPAPAADAPSPAAPAAAPPAAADDDSEYGAHDKHGKKKKDKDQDQAEKAAEAKP